MSLIDKIEEEFDYGEPIFIVELVNNRYSYNSVKSMLSKYVKKGYLKRYCPGVYFRYFKDKYGDSCINYDMMLERRYIKDNDDVFGYYSGVTLLNGCGLSTQVPYKREIITNKETNIKRNVTQGGNKIILRRSKEKITKDNYRYLQFANIMKYLSDYQIDDFVNELNDLFKNWNLDKIKLDETIKKQPRKVKDNYRRYLNNNEFA